MDNKRFDEYASLSCSLVDSVINNALIVLRTECNEGDLKKYQERMKVLEGDKKREKNETNLPQTAPNIDWSTIEHFTVNKGKENIEEFIKVSETTLQNYVIYQL